MSTTLKIFDGPVHLYVKRWTGINNDPMDDGNTVSWTNWTSVAYLKHSEESPTITFESEVSDVRTDGYNAPIERVITGESASISATIKELSVANLDWCFIGMEYLDAVTPGDDPNEAYFGDYGTAQLWSVGIEGYNSDGQKVIVFMQKATAGQSFEATYKKSDNEITIMFDAITDQDADAGKRLIRIREITTA